MVREVKAYLELSLVQDVKSLCKYLLRWVENWLKGQTRGMLVTGTKSNRRPVTNSVPQWSVLDPTLSNIFINVLNDGAGCTLSKFTDYTDVGEWLVYQRVVLPVQWTLTCWSDGLTGTS